MSEFEHALVTYLCKEPGCGFACTAHDEALEHKAESGHQWFHMSAGMPGVVGVGFGA